MKTLLNNLWLIMIFLIAVTYFMFFHYKPCNKPIQYRIGVFDEKFGISKGDFMDEINAAVDIWEKPISKDIFEYSPNSKLTINLIYDSRQKITQQNSVLKQDISNKKEIADSVKQDLMNMQANFKAKETEYKALLSKFNIRQNNYTGQVKYWNNMGGAPDAEFNRLNTEKAGIASDYSNLEAKRLELNDMSNEINTYINQYNSSINDTNSTINTVNKNAGREFEEGIYDPNTDTINIYQFEGKQKLLRVLAHELGHSLGIDHNDNPVSIMYALNLGTTEELSIDDIKDLKLKCEIQ